MTTRTAAEVAQEFRCSKRKVTDTATKNGIGIDLGGSAGFRFKEADVDLLWEALRPKSTIVAKRRRRRAS